MALSLDMAQRMVLQAQGLDGGWKLPRSKEGALTAITQLGYVQIDSISVIERAHHHVFWSRNEHYEHNMLNEMLSVDRSVFEYWTHAMSYVPMSDYRFCIPRMKRMVQGERHRKWVAENKKIMNEVLTRIRTEGPLGSSDFKTDGKRGPWWDWKPAKAALESLFDIGELMVTQRRGFQRIFDLTESVLPDAVNTTEPNKDELGRFLIRRTLGMLGVAPRNELRWGHKRGASFVLQALTDLIDANEVQQIEIEGLDQPFYALTDRLNKRPNRRKPQIHILSPFDNMTIRRSWVQTLFDFDYKLECYLPPDKRTYGYFSLPVLWGTQFIGRLDAKADRKSKTFIIRNFAFEKTVKPDEALLSALADKLHRFRAFNECDHIQIEKTVPSKMKAPLKKALK